MSKQFNNYVDITTILDPLDQLTAPRDRLSHINQFKGTYSYVRVFNQSKQNRKLVGFFENAFFAYLNNVMEYFDVEGLTNFIFNFRAFTEDSTIKEATSILEFLEKFNDQIKRMAKGDIFDLQSGHYVDEHDYNIDLAQNVLRSQNNLDQIIREFFSSSLYNLKETLVMGKYQQALEYVEDQTQKVNITTDLVDVVSLILKRNVIVLSSFFQDGKYTFVNSQFKDFGQNQGNLMILQNGIEQHHFVIFSLNPIDWYDNFYANYRKLKPKIGGGIQLKIVPNLKQQYPVITQEEKQMDIQKSCEICFAEQDLTEFLSLQKCDHYFCESCFKDHILSTKESGVKNLDDYKCPAVGCQIRINHEFMIALVGMQTFNDISQWNAENHVNTHCTNCQAAFYIMEQSKTKSIKCPQCQFLFCIQCNQELHQGDCKSDIELRIEEFYKASNDRVRMCPGCREIYQKDNHCQKVECLNCKLLFCFDCCFDQVAINNHDITYHRKGCKCYTPWIDPKTGQDVVQEIYNPIKCQRCKQNGFACKRPVETQAEFFAQNYLPLN